MRTRFCVGLAGALITTILTANPATAAVHPVATVGAPFSGIFGYSGDLSTVPPRHDTSIGDLAFDFYGANTSVRPKTGLIPRTSQRLSRSQTCGPRVGNQGHQCVSVSSLEGWRLVGWTMAT